MSSNSMTLRATLVLSLTAVCQFAAATDLASIRVEPLRGQSDDRARRDRYECHNWAVSQTGQVPGQRHSSESEKRRARAERVDRVITGAGIGATVGSLARATQGKNPSHGALAGGGIGAAVGALIGRKDRDEHEQAVFDDYVRALSACLEARGYELHADG